MIVEGVQIDGAVVQPSVHFERQRYNMHHPTTPLLFCQPHL
jgi:hypothetical protein